MRYLQENKNVIRIKLDAKDNKILPILSANARIPLTVLSKKVGLSRDAVDYRIKNYEKKGIIQGYRTMVDLSKFGYKSNHLFIRLNNPTKEIESRILKKISDYPFVRAVIKFSGNFDYEIAFVSRDIDNLDEVLTKVLSGCSDFLQDYELLTISKTFVAETFPPNFSDYKMERKNDKKYNKKIDPKDVEILRIISENAVLPLYDIAGRVKLSADAVAYRIKNMINSRVIIKFFPIINYSSLGYNLYTFLLNINSLDEQKEKILRNFLISDKSTLWAVKTIGRFNLLAYVLVNNIESLQQTSMNLRSLFPKQINHYETLIAYEEYKYTYFPNNLV